MVNEHIIQKSLSSTEVNERIEQGLVNKSAGTKSKSIKRIVFDNTISLFNFINLLLMLMLLLVGSYKNMFFMGIVVSNVVIGIVQEIRSKLAVDKLSIIVSDSIEAVRDGEVINIPIEGIVKDDVIILRSGAQIPCDCEIIDGFCFANESLLTGESDLIEKNIGDTLMSGSFVSSGEVYAKVVHIGEENYAAKLQKEASGTQKINSEIMRTLKKIVKVCSIAIAPFGVALFVNRFWINGKNLHDSVVDTVGLLINMIPQGLILLTSTVLAVAVIRLSQKKVLVQQLYCIETLARVDVLCLDKTGTITTGELEVVDIDYFIEDKDYVNTALKSIAVSSMDNNSTINAINGYLNCAPIEAVEIVPFSSEKKWSGATLSDRKSYVIGAAECIFDKNIYKELFEKISGVDDTLRVITFAISDNTFVSKDKLPDGLNPIALIIIKDRLRDNAEETIKFFDEQGVKLKVISGDNHRTVSKIASMVGVPDADKAVDSTTLDTDDKLEEAIENYSVFGRVTPQQKKKFVDTLKANGHTVAMTGDGVNDVLALKSSDCSIALASGSDAAKNISQLVLTDDDFIALPGVVAEGRRSINNIQRSASLFIVKTIYSFVFALIFIFATVKPPFQPIQMSLINALTIGLPSFVLALQPNHNRIKGDFMKNVILRACPASIVAVLNIVILIVLSSHFTDAEYSTVAVILTSLVGILMIIRLSIPFNPLRAALVAVVTIGMTLGIVLGMFVYPFTFFDFVPVSGFSLNVLIILSVSTLVLYNILYTISDKKLINGG